jgi:7-cyano-7-deazaguanine synthase in queuosine biosynthesis
MESKTILVMYSGGLDSLGTVYRLLTDPEYADYGIHIHHVHQRNVEHRHQAEAITVHMVLRELKRLGFEFEYSESEIASQHGKTGYMYDTDSINFFAGYTCSVNPDIALVAMGMQADDANHSLEQRRIRGNAILAAFTPVQKIYPVLNMTKREIYDGLPESLQNMFWSCRTPVYAEESIQPCGRCATCEQLKAAGIRG